MRDLPLTEIRELTGNKIGWAYAHYTQGRGVGSARLEVQSPVLVAETVSKSVLTVTAGPGGIAPGGTISVMYPMSSTPLAQSMRPWDWAQYDEELMPVAEIFSLHGRGEFHKNEPHYSPHSEPTLEGQTWQDQLAKGRKLGAIAASDSHRAWPGFAGLAGVWAESL